MKLSVGYIKQQRHD